ncbi:thioredoxin family protein [Runella sp. MFBS21]|uniref:thioredoxin family protein n=1 Tax=Runella sp. MFBS21 TaxID=3034018 RepID=UPI0023F9082E|nr:thioredoxin family protein [Runella sp. MFBS21]MDF7820968.1 thioredoxin family protein [Runella sp. MFBS21]
MNTQHTITPQHIKEAYTYETYKALSETLFSEGRTTADSPKLNTEAYLNYTKMNLQRSKRLEKTIQLTDTLKTTLDKIQEKYVWLVLTESWCGDAAQSIPVLVKMAEYQPHIELKVLLRDKNLDVMDAYLTNGGRSIPKLICLKADTLEELFTWGPRPQEVQALMIDLKAQGVSSAEVAEQIQRWYNADKTQSIQAEFETLIHANIPEVVDTIIK